MGLVTIGDLTTATMGRDTTGVEIGAMDIEADIITTDTIMAAGN